MLHMRLTTSSHSRICPSKMQILLPDKCYASETRNKASPISGHHTGMLIGPSFSPSINLFPCPDSQVGKVLPQRNDSGPSRQYGCCQFKSRSCSITLRSYMRRFASKMMTIMDFPRLCLVRFYLKKWAPWNK